MACLVVWGRRILHFTSSESHTKPLFFLPLNYELSSKDTAMYLLLPRPQECPLGAEARRLGTHAVRPAKHFQATSLPLTINSLPTAQMSQQPWLCFSAEARATLLLTRLYAKSEEYSVAQPHKNCCYYGDSQPALSPLLRSGVPQHDK